MAPGHYLFMRLWLAANWSIAEQTNCFISIENIELLLRGTALAMQREPIRRVGKFKYG
jgi:hypothetical protein